MQPGAYPPAFNTNENLSNIEKLIQPTTPKGPEFFDFFNIRKILLGKETYLGYYERGDMLAMDLMVRAMNENLHHGQIDFCMGQMVQYANNLRSTPGINGEFLKRITSQEFKYTQDQKITEIQAPQKRKGIIFNRG